MGIESGTRLTESHEQFMQRVGKVFPVASSLAWTPFERAIFNNVMGKLIFRYTYAEISDAMLQAACEKMQKIVRRSPRGTTPEFMLAERRRQPRSEAGTRDHVRV